MAVACFTCCVGGAPVEPKEEPPKWVRSEAEGEEVGAEVVGGRPVEIAVPDSILEFSVAILKRPVHNPNALVWDLVCGGTLIAPTWVLSAAHCFCGFGGSINPNDYILLVGVYNYLSNPQPLYQGSAAVTNIGSGCPENGNNFPCAATPGQSGSDYGTRGERIQIKRILCDSRFARGTNNSFLTGYDLALIELAAPSSKTPVSLNFDTKVPYEGQIATVAGYGNTNQVSILSMQSQVVMARVRAHMCRRDRFTRLYANHSPL